MRTTLGMTLGAVLLLSGCAGGGAGADSTELVCDEFAAFARDGQPAEGRAEVVASIGEVVGNADAEVADRYELLVNAEGGSEEAWAVAADSFAQACFDAGWDG